MTNNQILNQVKGERGTFLTEIQSKKLLKEAGIPIIDSKVARTRKEAVCCSREMGFPVVMKIFSPDVIHKSDSGGVKLGLKNITQVSDAYREIMVSIKRHYPSAQVEGVTIQKMASPGVEVIIGMSKDAQFGPVLMFGIGGILVELLKDVSFKIVPLTKRDAHEVIREINGYSLLEGYRGREAVDIAFLEDLVLRVSDFVDNNPEIRELDLNPIIANKSGAVIVDARIALEASNDRSSGLGELSVD